jgi:hypothetical protein
MQKLSSEGRVQMEVRDICELYGTSTLELLDDTKAKWIERFINGSDTFDKAHVSEAIHWICDAFKLGRPKITFTGSPGEYLSKVMYLTNTKAEVRKEIVRKIGIERVVKSFNTRVLDKWEDYELLLLNLTEINTFGVYLKMVNPSTGTYHIEGVPPNIRTCKEALSWRIGGIDWKPSQLT